MLSKSSDILIRPFERSDQAIAKSLILQGLKEHFGHINTTLNPDLNDIDQSYIQIGHYFAVAEKDRELIGTAALVYESSNIGRIVRVTVHSKHRRLGIGQKLIYHLLDIANQKYLNQILVETNLDWSAAIHLYHKCGFQEYSRDEKSIHFSLKL